MQNGNQSRKQWTRTFLGGLVAVGLLLGTVAVLPAAGQQDGKPAAPAGMRSRVNLNHASAQELEALPRIGPVLALRILEYREEHDGFAKPEELINVRGIGEKTFLQLRDLVTTETSNATDEVTQ